MTTHLLESEVMNACRTLFGPEPDIGRGFLFYIQPSGVKSAYRKRAKESHPDFFYTEDIRVQKFQADQFRSVLEAYDILSRFVSERQQGLWSPDAETRFPYNRRETHSKTSPDNQPFRKTGPAFYKGSIPFYILEVGSYLYYSGNISYSDLINALMWQRNQRPIIGDVALRWGWLEKTSLERISKEFKRGRFGEKAVNLGLLTGFQVRTLLFYQRSQQQRLGQYFLLNNILSSDILDDLVIKQHEHNSLVRASKKKNSTRWGV